MAAPPVLLQPLRSPVDLSGAARPLRRSPRWRTVIFHAVEGFVHNDGIAAPQPEEAH